MSKIIKNIVLTVLMAMIYVLSPDADSMAQKHIDAGIDEKLGNYLPMDLKFYNSNGDTVLLKDIIDKPTLLAFVYYACPGVCDPLQTELAWAVDRIQLEPGADFKVISLSFDHHENPEMAAKWKHNYLMTIKRKFSPDDWLFLTGDSVNIKKLTDAAGFYYKPSEKTFVHAATVIAVSPQGKISRYLFGLQFNPFDLKMALLDAQAGKTSPTIAKVLQFCFSYDPSGRRYTLNVTRIAGSIMLLAIGITVGILTIRKKKAKNKGAV